MDLTDLTDETIERAFEKVRGKVSIQDAELVRITVDQYDKAITFLNAHYVTDEPISKALGIGQSEEQDSKFRAMLKDGISLMLIDKRSGEVMAIRVTYIVRRNLNDKISSPHHRDDLLRAMQDFDRFCDDQARFFDRFETDLAFHFYALATNSKFRQRGLGSVIFNAALDMIKKIWAKAGLYQGRSQFKLLEKNIRKGRF